MFLLSPLGNEDQDVHLDYSKIIWSGMSEGLTFFLTFLKPLCCLKCILN